MKWKLIIITSITCIVLLLFISGKKTAYSGKYFRSGNTDEALILKPDNTFEIYCTLDKNNMDGSGKYQINDNHIDLKYNNKNDNVFQEHISTGEVFGSEIVFTSSNGTSEIKFEKK